MVPETRIRALHNAADGILLDVECWCGARVAIRTGRRRVVCSSAGTGLSPRFEGPVTPKLGAGLRDYGSNL